jgi:hypothetical protein
LQKKPVEITYITSLIRKVPKVEVSRNDLTVLRESLQSVHVSEGNMGSQMLDSGIESYRRE